MGDAQAPAVGEVVGIETRDESGLAVVTSYAGFFRVGGVASESIVNHFIILVPDSVVIVGPVGFRHNAESSGCIGSEL